MYVPHALQLGYWGMMIATMTVKMTSGILRHGNGQQQLLAGQLLPGFRLRWMSCYDRSRNMDGCPAMTRNRSRNNDNVDEEGTKYHFTLLYMWLKHVQFQVLEATTTAALALALAPASNLTSWSHFASKS